MLPPLQKFEFNENPWPDIPYLVLTPSDDSYGSCMTALWQVTEDLPKLFDEHPDIDAEEPWFGFAFKRGNQVESEYQVLQEAAKDAALRPQIETFVRRVIALFRETQAEPGFYVHEEKEAASDAIYFLVEAEPATYFERYLEYLEVIDLEHTVAQHDNVSLLAKKLSDEQLAKLRTTLEGLNGGEYFGEF